MECPALAYWCGSSFSAIFATSLLGANPSMTLASVHVREIGLKSDWISCGGKKGKGVDYGSLQQIRNIALPE